MPPNLQFIHAARQGWQPAHRSWALALMAALAWLLVLALSGLPAAAQTAKPVGSTAASALASQLTGRATIANADSYGLSDQFEVFEDVSASLALADVLEPAVQARFKPVRAGATSTNFGLSRSAFWLRITLLPTAEAPAPWLLEVGYPPLDRLELYTPDVLAYRAGGAAPAVTPAASDALPGAATGAAAAFRRQAGGDYLPYADRIVPHRNHVLPLTLQPGTPATIYLRIMSSGTVAAPVTLWKASARWKHDQGAYSALSRAAAPFRARCA